MKGKELGISIKTWQQRAAEESGEVVDVDVGGWGERDVNAEEGG